MAQIATKIEEIFMTDDDVLSIVVSPPGQKEVYHFSIRTKGKTLAILGEPGTKVVLEDGRFVDKRR